MSTIFSKIISGEIPCHKLLEDENYLSFLDLRPIHEGHALVIPKKEVDYIFDMEDQSLAGLTLFAKKVAVAIKKAIPCVKIGVLVYGLEVRHTHIHLVPVQGIAGEFSFANAKPASPEALKQTADKIKKHF